MVEIYFLNTYTYLLGPGVHLNSLAMVTKCFSEVNIGHVHSDHLPASARRTDVNSKLQTE